MEEKLKLELGKKYVAKNGDIIAIVEFDEHNDYNDCSPWMGAHIGLDGAVIQNDAGWYSDDGITHSMHLDLVKEYKEVPEKKRHIHADAIIAWVNGEKIQFLDNGEWLDVEWDDITWHKSIQYRVKPKTTSVTRGYVFVSDQGVVTVPASTNNDIEIEFIIDVKDGKIIDAKVKKD